jgi:hypothetical protein
LTQIGDAQAENYYSSSTAADWKDIRDASYPFFTVGRYSQFFLRVEVLNDDLVLKDKLRGITEPRTVDSNELPQDYNTVTSEPGGVYVWTHLGEPTQVSVSMSQWDTVANGKEWSLGDGNSGTWSTIDDSVPDDATFRNGKPVKVTFEPIPRRGTLFNEDPQLTSVKLTRLAHLKTTVFDQFWTVFNKPWDNMHPNNNKAVEKRLTSRMYHNNDHTQEWVDEAYRTGEELELFEWVFEPSFFKRDFGNGFEESIRYGDYEQLEALPGHNPKAAGGPAREEQAYLTLAFMSYLFYFSVFALDRSGRRQWCLNRKHIDKSKIVTSTWRGAAYGTEPQYAVEYPRNLADFYLRRTIFCREWYDTDWASSSTSSRTPLSPVRTDHPGTGGIVDAFQLKWVQPDISTFDPLAANFTGGTTDEWAVQYQLGNGTNINKQLRISDESYLWDNPTLDSFATDIAVTAFGSWNFNRAGLTDWFIPSPTRDFHPYWIVGMPDWAAWYTNLYLAADASECHACVQYPHGTVWRTSDQRPS